MNPDRIRTLAHKALGKVPDIMNRFLAAEAYDSAVMLLVPEGARFKLLWSPMRTDTLGYNWSCAVGLHVGWGVTSAEAVLDAAEKYWRDR